MESIHSPNVVDFIALLFIIVSVVLGYRRGMSGQLARMLGLITSFLIVIFAYGPVGDLLDHYTGLSPQGARVAGFLLTLALAFTATLLLQNLLFRALKVAIERRSDQIAGSLAGLIRATLVVLLVFIAMNLWPHQHLNKTFGAESTIGSVVLKAMPSLREKLGGLPGVRGGSAKKKSGAPRSGGIRGAKRERMEDIKTLTED